MAERVGFEPTIPVKVCPLSRRIVSTTHAPLRVVQHSALSTQHSALSHPGIRGAALEEHSSTPASEKFLQQLGAASCQDPCSHLHPMIQFGMVQHFDH